MSYDLIERLRSYRSFDEWGDVQHAVCDEAADELARLHTQLGLQKAMVQDERRLRIRREAKLARLRAEVERLTAALADERAHADALAEALTKAGEALSSVCPGEVGEALQQHRARRQG